jgi:hypothetical protein
MPARVTHSAEPKWNRFDPLFGNRRVDLDQQASAATLDLLEHLLTQTDLQHLLLIGAYRDNEAADHRP